MSSVVPDCTKCGKPFTLPGHYRVNAGLCPDCRPIPLCKTCHGAGNRFIDKKKPPKPGKSAGHWEKCEACNGTRHVDAVALPCLYCKFIYHFTLESPEACGVFNVFCQNGECEDKYAATM